MKNVKCMMILSIITAMDFFASIEVAFFLTKSLNMSQIYLVYSLFSIFIVILEVPSGYLGDRLGYKTSLMLGYTCGVIGMAGFILGNGFLIIVLSYLFLALMTSLISGTEEALLYDSLVECNKERQFEEVYSKIKSYSYAATVVGNIVAGIIAQKNIIINVVINGIICIIAIILLMYIKQPSFGNKMNSGENKSKKIIEECKDIWNILLISGLFMTSTLIGTKFSQPMMLEGKIPLTFFGIFVATCSVINSIASYFAYKLDKIPFEVIMTIPSIILIIIGISENGLFVISLFIIAACRAIGNVKLTVKLNEQISPDSKYRATINSMKNLLFRLLYALIVFVAGIIADYSLFMALQICGSILLFGIVISIYLFRKLPVHFK